MANGGSEKYLKGAEALLASSLAQNVTAGGILEFFNRKPSLRHASNKAPGPLRQKFTANEVALELIRRNGTGLQAYVATERLDRTDVIIWGAEEVNDLSPVARYRCLGTRPSSEQAVSIGKRYFPCHWILWISRNLRSRGFLKIREAFSAFVLSRWHSPKWPTQILPGECPF